MKEVSLLKSALGLLLLIMGGSFRVLGQTVPKPELYQVTQTTPNAAALGKYGAYPVSMYTGVPAIDLPFYEVTAGRIKIPIGLSYHSGGIKVEEIASSNGLGWSLNAGGVITRTVMGLPDDLNYTGSESFFTASRSVQNMLANSASIDSSEFYNDYFKKVLTLKVDGEPDVFYYNFGKYSGKFMYHQDDGRFYTIPYSAINITYDHNGKIFTLTDPDGIAYSFGVTETSIRETVNSEVVEVVTAWYLHNVSDPVSSKSVSFSYYNTDLMYSTMSSQVHYMPVYGTDISRNSKQDPFFNVKKVKEIAFSSGRVSFQYGLSRCDLPGDSALTAIKVYNNFDKLVKSIGLNYDYFLSAGHANYPEFCSDKPESMFKRLKLTGIDEKPVDGSAAPPLPHVFEYNDVPLPSRLSLSQDHWGFYNGKNNLYLYPPATMTIGSFTVNLTGGDRDVDINYTKAGMLKKITYPTGGYTAFEFENNKAENASLPALTDDRNAGLGGIVGGYAETLFSVNSSSCSQNYNNILGGAYVSVNVSGLDLHMIRTLGFPGNSADIKIVDASTGTQVYRIIKIGNGTDQDNTPSTFYLPNGNYKLIADCIDNPFSYTYESTTVALTWKDCSADLNRYVGGMRVKKITSYSDLNTNAIVKSYKYVKENNALASSGQTHFNPRYSYWVHINESAESEITKTCLKRFSYSNYPLVNESGKSAGYSNVIEMDGDDRANGYTQIRYTNYSDYDDTDGGSTPVGKPTSYQWLRGLELERKTYKREGSSDVLVSQVINEYSTDVLGSNSKFFKGINGLWKLEDDNFWELPGEDYFFLGAIVPAYDPYIVYSDYVYANHIKERSYDGSNYLEIEKKIIANPKNLLPVSVETTNSKGEKEIITNKYPVDYNVSGAVHPKGQSINYLMDLNFVSPVIEAFKEKQVGSNPRKLINSVFTSYKASHPLADTIFSFRGNVSPVQDYAGVQINTSGFSSTVNYDPTIIFEVYGDSRELLQQKKANNVMFSYIWDHNITYPIASATNASYSSISYSSFEADSKGNWDYSSAGVRTDCGSVTGKQAYTLATAYIERTALNSSKTYIITYWLKNNGGTASINSGDGGSLLIEKNGWKLYEKEITGTSAVTISGNGTIDELRLYPKDAQMTTYAYEPLIGITSQCDANNRITYYEYDSFNRLRWVRDMDRNILKAYEYKYRQPL
jgi:hypothetical protein